MKYVFLRHNFTEHIRCYPMSPDSGDKLAHAQAVDTRPSCRASVILETNRPGDEANCCLELVVLGPDIRGLKCVCSA